MGFIPSRAWMLTGLLAGVLVSPPLRADPGDADNSRDYTGFPRLPGYVISDYDEDNPAQFTFPVSRPLPVDLDRVANLKVSGHRYVIRYELGPDAKAQSLLETQKAYEKMAVDGGYKLEKTGAVGDVTETFHRTQNGRETWVCLEPGGSFNILTIVESSLPATAAALKQPSMPITPRVTAMVTSPLPVLQSKTPALAPPPAKPILPPPPSAVSPLADDPLYAALMKDGRVILPLAFLPGKPDLDADSQPVIDRVAAILRRHPEMQLEIDGHTDNSGSAAANQYLSKQRAAAVRGMLVAEKIDRRRLTSVGMGGSQPLVEENTAEGREKNRRIELVLQNPIEPLSPAPKATAQQNVPAKPVIKPVTKSVTQQKAPPTETVWLDEGASHGPAPNGTNYYPASNSGK